MQCEAMIDGVQCWEDQGHYPKTKHMHITYGGRVIKWRESPYGPCDVEQKTLKGV